MLGTPAPSGAEWGMADAYVKRILRRAVDDTLGFFGWKKKAPVVCRRLARHPLSAP